VVAVEYVTESSDDRVVPAAELLELWERDELGDARCTPAEEVGQSVWSHPLGLSTRLAVAELGSRVVGAAHLSLDTANPLTAWVRWLVVDPAHRRRGVGRALIAALRRTARAEGFAQLGHAALAADDMATGFGTAIGATPGLDVEQNRLLIADLPPGLVAGWIARSSERAKGYSLVAFNNKCPEEYLERCARAYEIMNTAPDQEAEPLRVDADRVRAGLAVHAGRGEGFHTTALHEQSGELVALTEMRHIRFRPWHAGQGDTCTHPAHRDKGLGRWIKAHNLQWLLDKHPEVEEIDTWNAGVNEPMLNINRELGFRRIRTWSHWRLQT
jgi:GNAT superfamily N-acetyltransferase